MRVAHLLVWSSHRHQIAQVAFWAQVAPVVVEVHLCRCPSSVLMDILRCHFASAGSCPFDFREPLPGVYRMQPSPCYAQETQHPAASLLGLRREVS
jgi:hypothetical protein